MTALTANLRKAAILVRSVDADTAAVLLAQLAPAEAKAVRAAIQSLGPVDPDERADVAAELRRAGPLATEDPRCGIDVEISSSAADQSAAQATPEGDFTIRDATRDRRRWTGATNPASAPADPCR